jgi:hypothetical protein
MIDLAQYAELKNLLDRIEAIEGELTPNEKRRYLDMKGLYSEPCQVAFGDVRMLEVILRNVEIRKHYAIDKDKDTQRTISFGRARRRAPR